MKRKRLIIILIILVVPAVIFTVLNLRGSGDSTRTQLDQLFNDNKQIVELSKEAASDASLFGLKTAAASLAAATTSDNQLLTAYYQDRYGKTPKTVKSAKDATPLDKLKAAEAGSGYDSIYKQAVTELLNGNLALAKTMHAQAKRAELKAMLEQLYDNQAIGLEQLNSSP